MSTLATNKVSLFSPRPRKESKKAKEELLLGKNYILVSDMGFWGLGISGLDFWVIGLWVFDFSFNPLVSGVASFQFN